MRVFGCVDSQDAGNKGLGVCSWVKRESVVEEHVGGRRLYSLFCLSQFQGVIV